MTLTAGVISDRFFAFLELTLLLDITGARLYCTMRQDLMTEFDMRLPQRECRMTSRSVSVKGVISTRRAIAFLLPATTATRRRFT
jgi:hypothetical protein